MKNKKLYITLGILSIIFLSIGGTFAYLTVSATATNITQIKSGNLTMTVDGGGNENVNLFPSTCTSEYAIKRVIKASAVNTSGGKVSFSIGMNVAVLSDSLKRTTMKYALSTSATSCTDGLIASGNFSNATVGSDIWLIKNDYDGITNSGNTYNKTYYLYIWLDQSETQNLSGSISVKMKGTSSNNPNLTTEAVKFFPLYETIVNSAVTTTIIDFSKTSVQDNTNGIYMTTDTDSGKPVYYYRGNVDNHLLFANFCWRIVRTTETGGIKLIYNGVQRKNYETTIPVEENSYKNVTNDTTYPYTFDSTNKTWTSTNKTNSTTSTITFSVDTAGDYVLSYVISSETNWDKTLFYKNGTKLEERNGTGEGTITLSELTTSDVIKVEYEKDSVGSSDNDTVVFSISKGEGNPIKTCDNTGYAATIGSSVFNESYIDEKYVGYMYGSNIDDTANTDDSTIKEVIDTWYKNNMTSYTSQLEDTVFCNDRSYTTNADFVYFGANKRLETNKQPTLKCQNEKDRFTVDASNGNGALTYPVGLITADETAYAGGVYGSSNANSSFYLYIGRFYWTLSPELCFNIGSFTFDLNDDGNISTNILAESSGVRPSVSLKPGIGITGGSGTAEDPYIVN